LIYTLPHIHLLLTDSQGRRVGKDPLTGEIYREIPGSDYGYEEPYGQLEGSEGASEVLGFNELTIMDPISDSYTLQAFSEIDTDFKIHHWSYDQYAEVQQQT